MPATQFSKRDKKFWKLIWSVFIYWPLNVGPVIWICSGFMMNEDGLLSISGRHGDNFRESVAAGRNLSSRSSISLWNLNKYFRNSFSMSTQSSSEEDWSCNLLMQISTSVRYSNTFFWRAKKVFTENLFSWRATRFVLIFNRREKSLSVICSCY